MNVKGYEIMKRLAILVSISLVIGIPLSYGCKNLNRIKIEEASTTESSNQSNWEEEVNTTESESNSNWVEEFNKLEKEIDEQERLERDIEGEFYDSLTAVSYEAGKQMIIDFLVDYRGYDEETVNKVINNIGWDWKFNCLASYRRLLEEGHREDVIVVMLRASQFTEEEIQYAIDNH